MSEVRTAPVKAQYQGVLSPDDPWAAAAAWPPGAFALEVPDGDGEQSLWWKCPCGCGHISFIQVGNGFKPSTSPSWLWNGSTEAADLQPSVHRVGHWHGWLRNGVWESV